MFVLFPWRHFSRFVKLQIILEGGARPLFQDKNVGVGVGDGMELKVIVVEGFFTERYQNKKEKNQEFPRRETWMVLDV